MSQEQIASKAYSRIQNISRRCTTGEGCPDEDHEYPQPGALLPEESL